MGDDQGAAVALAPLPDERHDVAKWVVGTVAVLCWGAFFDQLTRVARWVLDTSTTNPPLQDLHSRYIDAHIALVHGHLYGYGTGAFTYPPITAYVFVPFHAIGWHATEVLWTVANVVVLAALLAISLHRWCSFRAADAWLWSAALAAPAVIFVLYPFHSLLYWGQLALFLLFLVFADLFVVPRRYRGLLIGVATAIKLLPALFIVWFLAKREIAAVVRIAGSFAFLTLLAAALWPHASAQYWFHILPTGRDVLMVADPLNLSTAHGRWYFGVGKPVNQSIRGLLARPPFLVSGTAAWVVVGVVVLAIGVWVTIRCLAAHRELLGFVVLSLTTVLVSPVSWVHYWVFAALAPIVAVDEWRRDRAITVASIILTCSMCANMEDTRLTGLFSDGHQFDQMASVEVFVVRNLYVLGGLVFLAIVTWRAVVWQQTASAAPAVAPDAVTVPTP